MNVLVVGKPVDKLLLELLGHCKVDDIIVVPGDGTLEDLAMDIGVMKECDACYFCVNNGPESNVLMFTALEYNIPIIGRQEFGKGITKVEHGGV